MKLRTTISFVVAIALAIVTAIVGTDYVKKHGGRGVSASRAVVVKRDLEPGYVIQATDVALAEVPTSMLTPKTLRDVKDAVGRTVVMTIATNYPVTEGVLAPPGSGAGMQAMIPAGMRLVTVDVSESSGVAGLITPGCKVDVIATLHDGDQSLATTIVENVKVQFVQRGSTRSSSGRVNASNTAVDAGPVKTVSLLVTPQQAVKIELANSEGKPRLVLRGNADETADGNAQINRNKLLGKPDEVKPELPAPVEVVAPEPVKKGTSIQIIKGGNESTVTFDENGNGKAEEGKSGATPASGKQPRSDGRPKPAGAARNESESGAAPDQAPRTDAGRGNLP